MSVGAEWGSEAWQNVVKRCFFSAGINQTNLCSYLLPCTCPPGNSQYSPFLCVTVSTPTIDCESQGGVNRCSPNVATWHSFSPTFFP